MDRTYNPNKPFAILMNGRPEDPDSHQSIAVYTPEEHQEYRKKGWKPAKEFTSMSVRALEHPKGYWNE
jgi:hypothetical protein